MRQNTSNPESGDTTIVEVEDKSKGALPKVSGSQTLHRGLDLLDQVIDGPVKLADLSERMGLARSTTHRLANAMVERGFLTFLPREGYQLGPKLLQLGFLAQAQADLVQIARPHLEALAAASEDVVHLGRLDGDQALYLDKIPGRRRVEISSRIGDRQPLTSTGLGKALLLDEAEAHWHRAFDAERDAGIHAADYTIWLDRMRAYALAGRAYDLEENEDQIRCVAAPIRDASGAIVAAISLSSAAQYMDDDRMATLSTDVRTTANRVSADLGWTPGLKPRRPARR
ncbi:MAG: IclR family transcriptional regulator [bacterium]|nr:IclR family transcriptional regulator [bacterium]